MASVPPWPADLKLSLNVRNWLEWSQHLLMSLQMGQLNQYPLGLLGCPDISIDPLGFHNWQGNDRMVLGYIGYMHAHMYSSELQCIIHCMLSSEAYQLLCTWHKKCSGLTQVQLIQKNGADQI